MKKSTVLLAIVLLLNLSACQTKMKDQKTSGFQQPKVKVTFAQQKENPPLAVFQGRDVNNVGLISMKIKDNKSVMKLNFVQILKAMERTKIDMDKERLIPLLLDDETKKDIDYQLIVNYRDGSNEIYLIWLKSEEVVIARKDNPKQQHLEHYIIKDANAKQISDLFKFK